MLTIDLHAGQIQGFFDIPTDNLFAAPVMVARHQGAARRADKLMVVSPDVGGVVRARALAKRLDAPLAIVDKRRERAGESEVMNIIGDVDGALLHPGRRHRRFRRHAVQRRRRAARSKGAEDVFAYITHGVLSGGAVAAHRGLEAEGAGHHRFDPADRGRARRPRNIRVLTIAPLLGEAIRRIADESSVSSLFD